MSGLADAATLPRELRCWQCGSSRANSRPYPGHSTVRRLRMRYVEAGARITNRAAVLEWAPRCARVPAGHRKKTVGVTPRTFARRCSATAVGVALACFQTADI